MKRFDLAHSVLDEQSAAKTEFRKPSAVVDPSTGCTISLGNFVPVAFVARDWNVTPRRIRVLLAAGRLLGRCQPNGYWEVRFPYSFTFGTRGPSLKRQQRPPKRPRSSAQPGSDAGIVTQTT
ncbi:MAG: hypothetical protein WBM09_13475 [Gallionella sp.]